MHWKKQTYPIIPRILTSDEKWLDTAGNVLQRHAQHLSGSGQHQTPLIKEIVDETADKEKLLQYASETKK